MFFPSKERKCNSGSEELALRGVGREEEVEEEVEKGKMVKEKKRKGEEKTVRSEREEN